VALTGEEGVASDLLDEGDWYAGAEPEGRVAVGVTGDSVKQQELWAARLADGESPVMVGWRPRWCGHAGAKLTHSLFARVS